MCLRLEHRIALATRLSGSLKDSKSKKDVGNECTKAKSLIKRGHNEVAPLAISMVELHCVLQTTHDVNGSLTALR